MPHKDPQAESTYRKEYRQRPHVKARIQRNYERTRETLKVGQRRRWLFRQFGLTPEDWDAMFAAQGHICGACGSPSPRRRNGKWATDHDHATGKVRGILCYVCNVALGYYENNQRNALLRAYLGRVT
jgi:hypothetical protein